MMLSTIRCVVVFRKRRLFECVLDCVVGYHFFFEDVGAGLGGLDHFDDLAVCTAFTFLQGGHCFLCHILGGLGAYR